MTKNDIDPGTSRPLFVTDDLTKKKFLIDTVADLRVYPASRLDKKPSYDISDLPTVRYVWCYYADTGSGYETAI